MATTLWHICHLLARSEWWLGFSSAPMLEKAPQPVDAAALNGSHWAEIELATQFHMEGLSYE
jgi:hypothetical protein